MKNAKKKVPQPVGVKPPVTEVAKSTTGKVAKSTAKATASERAKTSTMKPGTKAAKVVALLRRPGGTTIAGIAKAIGWQFHSVRAFVSAALGKRMGLKITSELNEKGQRVYSTEE